MALESFRKSLKNARLQSASFLRWKQLMLFCCCFPYGLKLNQNDRAGLSGFSSVTNFKKIMESCFFPCMVSPAELFLVCMLSPCVIYNHPEARTCKYMVMNTHRNTVITCPDVGDKCFDSGLYYIFSEPNHSADLPRDSTQPCHNDFRRKPQETWWFWVLVKAKQKSVG